MGCRRRQGHRRRQRHRRGPGRHRRKADSTRHVPGQDKVGPQRRAQRERQPRVQADCARERHRRKRINVEIRCSGGKIVGKAPVPGRIGKARTPEAANRKQHHRQIAGIQIEGLPAQRHRRRQGGKAARVGKRVVISRGIESRLNDQRRVLANSSTANVLVTPDTAPVAVA